MNQCQKKAYAKINLSLDVIGRLPNGYHMVRMIMQTVDICDELTLERTESGITVTTDSEALSTDRDNLVYQAAELMIEEFRIEEGVKIHLRKKIPIAAGMAGGSTDAAAVMKGMNELFELGASEERLMELGVRIGADVPYCIMGGTALAEGIGEKLTPLSPAPQCVLLVAKPRMGISTKYVYQRLDALEEYHHPDIGGMMEAIEKEDLKAVADKLENVLENVTIDALPVIAVIKDRMTKGGALGCLMSGSGPTVFGIYEDVALAEAAARILRDEIHVGEVFVTRFVGR